MMDIKQAAEKIVNLVERGLGCHAEYEEYIKQAINSVLIEKGNLRICAKNHWYTKEWDGCPTCAMMGGVSIHITDLQEEIKQLKGEENMDSVKADRYKKKERAKAQAKSQDLLRQERDNLRREQSKHSEQLAILKDALKHAQAKNEELHAIINTLNTEIAKLTEKK